MAFTVDGCVSSLIGMGYVFSLRADGSVLVKQPAKRDPRAADMMSFLALHKEEVRAVVREREGVQMRLDALESAAGPAEMAKDDAIVIKKPLDEVEGFDQIRPADGSVLPEPDADGIVRLVRVPPEVAFAVGELISDGKAELVGKVVYRRLSGLFDVTYRVVES